MSQPRVDPEQLIDFLNTIDTDAQTDLLDSPVEFAAWANGQGCEPGDPELARQIRDALRAAIQGTATAAQRLTVPVAVEIGAEPRLVTPSIAETALRVAVELVAAGHWDRVKLCPADDCREAFYDSSRNRSRIWCTMADCGNLTKVRNYRRREA